MTQVIDYQTPRQTSPRYALRSLTLSCLVPLATLKSLTAAKAIQGIHEGYLGIIAAAAIALLLIGIAADLAMIWILTRQWQNRKRWVFPIPVFISVPLNLFLPMCAGFSLSITLDPLMGKSTMALIAEGSLLLAIFYLVLVVWTCAATDRDRRNRLTGESPIGSLD